MQMDEDEIDSFVGIRDSLQKKERELEAEKERLLNVIEDDNISLHQIKELNAKLKKEFNETYAKFNQMPKNIDKKQAKNLKNKIRELSEILAQLEDDLSAQKEHNTLLAGSIRNKSFVASGVDSVSFVKKSLLSELHELTRKGATPELLLKKEKQISMCDNLF